MMMSCRKLKRQFRMRKQQMYRWFLQSINLISRLGREDEMMRWAFVTTQHLRRNGSLEPIHCSRRRRHAIIVNITMKWFSSVMMKHWFCRCNSRIWWARIYHRLHNAFNLSPLHNCINYGNTPRGVGVSGYRHPDVKNCDDTPQNECWKKLTTFFGSVFNSHHQKFTKNQKNARKTENE